jgi:hypothetical protein
VPGPRTLTATYNGSTNYKTSVSSGTTHQVMAKLFIPIVSKPAPAP